MTHNISKFLALGLLTVQSSYLPGNQVKKLPNIVFILVDDMGYGDVSALNEHSKIKTTNIDRLANSGAVFTDAHASSSVSTPSRYSLLTGRYNWRTTLKRGVYNGYSKPLIPPERTTIASMLKRINYNTACIGKWHLGWEWDNIDKGTDSVNFSKPVKGGPICLGFDYFYGISASLDMPPYVYVENDKPTAFPNRITEGKGYKLWRLGPTAPDFKHDGVLINFISRAEKYIAQKSKDKNPFFLYLPLSAPHTPILPSAEFQGKSGLNPYGDFVLMVDVMIGRIIATIDKAGISENTIIVFISDNGCSPTVNTTELEAKGHYPSYIYRGYKADLYDGGHRIPCIVNWPSRINPHKVSQTICLTDFMATIANITGYKLRDNEGEDSFNLLPLLLNLNTPHTMREATVHHSINGSFTIRKGDWKLLLSPDSGGWSYPRPDKDQAIISTLPKIQLYNLKRDASEKNNVYSEYPEIVKELKAILISYIKNGRSTPGLHQQNDGIANWKELNWTNEN